MSKIYKHKIGTEEYPFPIQIKKTNNSNGEPTTEVLWAASEEDAFYIPTMRECTTDEFYGKLLRDVISDPTLLQDMTELLTRLDVTRTPEDSKSYSYNPIGAPGNGKTFLMKALGELVHPKGAMVIDCKNLKDAEEIYKKTNIGVSKASKRKRIDAHIEMANRGEGEPLSPQAILYLKQNLGNDAVTQEVRDGVKITAIDWQEADVSAEVLELVCDKVMQMENIEYKEDAGSVGLVTENGPLIQALCNEDSPDYGRLVILDESNRLPEGDALLTIQAFFSEPGAKKLVLEGADGKAFTIKREELPSTFLFLGTANQAMEEMGESARRQSRPEISRQGQGIDLRLISEPSRDDFISRTLKHLTGVPAYYTYMADRKHWDANPEALKDELMYQRTVGLSREQIKEIPKEEIFNIQRIDKVLKVSTQVASLLYETDKFIEVLSKDTSLPNEYTEYLKKEAVVDLRYIFKIIQHSKIDQAKGRTGKGVFKRKKSETTTNQENIDYEISKRIAGRSKKHMLHRGTKLESELSQKIYNIIMPEDIDLKLQDSDDPKDAFQKIEKAYAGLMQTAKGLKFEFAGYQGKDSVSELYNAKESDFPQQVSESIKKVLLDAINETYNTTFREADVIDDEELAEALKMLSIEDNEQSYVVPNLDKDTSYIQPLRKVYITQGREEDGVDREDLLTVKEFTNSFILEKMRSRNMKRLANEKVSIPQGETIDDTALKIANGEHEIFQTSTLMLNNKEKEDTSIAHIIYNKNTDYAIVYADFDISSREQEELKKNKVYFINYHKLKDSQDEKFDPITNVLNRQINGVQAVDEDVIASALMLRIEPTLAGANTSICSNMSQFLSLLSDIEELDFIQKDKIQSVMLTSKEFDAKVPVQAILRTKGR